jgi:hypothetical protein
MQQHEIDAVVKLRGEGLEYSAIAAKLKMSIDQVKRRFYASGKPQPEKPEKMEKPVIEKYQVGGDAKDIKITTLSDEVNRLKSEIKKLHRINHEGDVVREMLGNLDYDLAKPPKWLIENFTKKGSHGLPEIPITAWADWHAGEVVSLDATNGVNEYNLSIMDKRIKKLVSTTIDIAKNHGPLTGKGIVVNLVGDMVSGMLHPELVKTDEKSPLECATEVAGKILWGLQQMADAFGQVYVPAVCGNHGRMTEKPQYKGYVTENWDWLIYNIVISMLKSQGDDRIKIDIKIANEIPYQVYGFGYVLLHGDMMGVKGGDGIIGSVGPIMRGENKTRNRLASSNIEYDMLVLGHFHQPLWLTRAIVANSLKGYCEYAKNALGAPPTAASQPLWFQHPKHGITSRWEIKVDEPATYSVAPEWVTFSPAK